MPSGFQGELFLTTAFMMVSSFLMPAYSSRVKGAAFLSLPRPLRRGWSSRLELVVGDPVQPQDVTPENLQETVLSLRGSWK